MSISREEFQQAFHETVAVNFADIPTQEFEIEFAFSEKFIRKMDNLIALQQEGFWRGLNIARKYIAVIVIVLLGVSISACGINHVVTYFYGTVYEEMREEFYGGVTATEIAYVYRIADVPEGFEIQSRTMSTEYQETEYKNERGHRIWFLQDAVSGLKRYIQDETITQNTVIIRGLEVVIFENNDLIGAIWIEDGYFMEIIYEGCKDAEEIIAIVESIE